MLPKESPAVLMVGNFAQAGPVYGSVGHELAAKLESAGWYVLRTSYHQTRILKVMDMLRTSWRARNRFEVAHVELYSGPAFLWGEAVCKVLRWLGKPYVIALHGGNLPNFALKHAQRVHTLLRSAVAVISPSPYLQKTFIGSRPDVQLMPNALDLSSYPGRLRKRARPRMIWLRAFRAMYAPETAVASLARVVPEHPAACLTMIGPDRKDGSLERTMALARELGVYDRISFITGIPKSEVGAYLDQADIFLNTSTVDNTPVSVVEALACGLCVVSTNVGGMPHLLREGQDGMLVPPRDAIAMSSAITRVVADDGLAAKLSRNALLRATDYDWSNVLPRWNHLLLSARGNNRVSSSEKVSREPLA